MRLTRDYERVLEVAGYCLVPAKPVLFIIGW